MFSKYKRLTPFLPALKPKVYRRRPRLPQSRSDRSSVARESRPHVTRSGGVPPPGTPFSSSLPKKYAPTCNKPQSRERKRAAWPQPHRILHLSYMHIPLEDIVHFCTLHPKCTAGVPACPGREAHLEALPRSKTAPRSPTSLPTPYTRNFPPTTTPHRVPVPIRTHFPPTCTNVLLKIQRVTLAQIHLLLVAHLPYPKTFDF